MIKTIISFLVFMVVLGFQADYCTAESRKIKLNSSEANLLNDLQRGEWLNKAYIEKLQSTRSPQKAVNGITETSFSIKKDHNDYSIFVIYNFHEGGEPFKITEIKKISGKEVTYELLTHAQSDVIEKNSIFILFKKKGAAEIQWSYQSNHEKVINTFTRVEPSVYVFVNRLLLAGEYKNKEGRSFLFTEAGIARWPNKNFRYEIVLDYIGSPAQCDLLMEVDERGRFINTAVIYQFVWQNDNLLIYAVDNTGTMPLCEKKKLLYKLRRIK